jgi:hypothetical protein
MKKIIIGASILAFSTAAYAISSNSNQNACFGQARAFFSGMGINGEVISTRKGNNAQMNADFREACQTAE